MGARVSKELISCYTPVMKRLLPLIVFIILIPIAMYAGYNRRVPNPDPDHTHADFAVWIDGKELDFSAQKYMTTEEDETKLPAGSLRLSLHLHDGDGHVAHRHKPGLGFGDFLTSIGFTLTSTCFTTDDGIKTCNTDDKKWQLFVNGKEIMPLDTNYVFVDGDHILLTYGADAAELQHEESLMTDDACKYSKTCPGRGPPPTESCIADPTVPCKIVP